MLTAATNRSSSRDGVHVQVVVRCRPLNQKEITKGIQSVVSCSSREVCISDKAQNMKKYTFDRVLGSESSQEVVFDEVIRPFVENVLDGFDCTIFAYGQTGTGKTYTMGGESSLETTKGELPKEAGIIPRTIKRIFQKLQGSDSTVTVNFLELYNEELTDLLDPWSDQVDKDGNKKKKKIMRIMEDQTTESGAKLRRGILLTPYPEDCVVTNETEILQILERGSAHRQTAETLLNERSSRSHSIFVISIHMKETKSNGEDVIKVGKLNLVDLAGSENVSRAGSNRIEERQREAGSINQSLLTLGRVINALVDKSAHVPYRDSNLTRLLRDSLGGSTKTLMIATISSGETCQEETYKTLDYANRAKSIKNRPEVNQRISKTDLVKDLHAEIKRLKEELVHQRRKEGVIALPLEKHAQNEADRKAMLQELDKARDEVKVLNQKVSDTAHLVKNLEEVKEKTELELQKKDDFIKEQSEKLKDQIYWSETYQKNCVELSQQLQTHSGDLREVLISLQSHKSILEQLQENLLANENISKEAMEIVRTQIEDICLFMDKAISEHLAKSKDSFLVLEAKKHKREKQDQKVDQMTARITKMQTLSDKEVSDLWPKSMEKIEEDISDCQKYYEDLKNSAEDLVSQGFDNIEHRVTVLQDQWKQEQENMKKQTSFRKQNLRLEKDRIVEQKRKLEYMKEDAQRHETLAFTKIQETTAKILEETLSRCLKEALPQICATATEAIQPEKSALDTCTIMANNFEKAVEELDQEEYLFDKGKEDVVAELQTTKDLTIQQLRNLTNKQKENSIRTSQPSSLEIISLLKDAHEQSQQLLKKELGTLKEEIGTGIKDQEQENRKCEEHMQMIFNFANELCKASSEQLANFKDQYLALSERFDWKAPIPVTSNKCLDFGEDACSEESVRVAEDQETISSLTGSSGGRSKSHVDQAKKRNMKENHLTNNTPGVLPNRVPRKAKRGKRLPVQDDVPIPKGSTNLNNDG